MKQRVSKSRHNKAFKSDSQRLAVSLRSSIAKRRSHLNAALEVQGKLCNIKTISEFLIQFFWYLFFYIRKIRIKSFWTV
ncbi:hypothetical protein CGH24_23125 [Vibrio parahaemolyticus]|nr:hypothetical protein CGH24_23125 [Vibrio parahaemolyticus]